MTINQIIRRKLINPLDISSHRVSHATPYIYISLYILLCVFSQLLINCYNENKLLAMTLISTLFLNFSSIKLQMVYKQLCST